MKFRKLLSITLTLVLFSLIFGVSSTALAATGDNGPPVDRIEIVHYPHAPDKIFAGKEGGPLVEQSGYQTSGLTWEDGAITYLVNLGGRSSDFLTGIENSFAAWNAVGTSFQASYDTSTALLPGKLEGAYNRKTRTWGTPKNVVGWNRVSYKNAIAVTYIWSSGGYILEVDTAFNNSNTYRWWQNSAGDEVWDFADTSAYDVDVQNLMTHEAGHWLVLDDLYDAGSTALTMYGYAGQRELKKRSLDPGDIAGVEFLY